MNSSFYDMADNSFDLRLEAKMEATSPWPQSTSSSLAGGDPPNQVILKRIGNALPMRPDSSGTSGSTRSAGGSAAPAPAGMHVVSGSSHTLAGRPGSDGSSGGGPALPPQSGGGGGGGASAPVAPSPPAHQARPPPPPSAPAPSRKPSMLPGAKPAARDAVLLKGGKVWYSPRGTMHARGADGRVYSEEALQKMTTEEKLNEIFPLRHKSPR